jgi:hypothetical protein
VPVPLESIYQSNPPHLPPHAIFFAIVQHKGLV